MQTYKGKEEKIVASEPVEIKTKMPGACCCVSAAGRGDSFGFAGDSGRKNCLRFEIAGAKAALAWDSEEPNMMWIGRRDRPNEAVARDPGLMSDAARTYSNYPGGHAEGFPDTFKQCFKAFYNYIAAGISPRRRPTRLLPTATARSFSARRSQRVINRAAG